MKNIIKLLNICFLLLLAANCSDFLDEKSDSRLATPQTLEDNQALLDHYNLINSGNLSSELLSGDIYISDADYNSADYDAEKRLYTWQSDYVSQESGNDWQNIYFKINICNTVLHNIQVYNIKGADNVRGQALALRGALYLEAAQLWCLVYNKETALSDLGLPLRLNPDMNIVSVRSNLQETYNQIIKDLNDAVNLLPITQVAVSRPSKVAALAWLARACLYQGDYEHALTYSKEALSYDGKLIDFNTLNKADAYPLKDKNTEVLFPLYMSYSSLLGSSVAKISSDIFASFDDNDLRKDLFFRKNLANEILFKGNYSGGSTRTSVLANDELYLTLAEAYARLNNTVDAIAILNKLLVTRWKTGTYKNYIITDKKEVLQLIKEERRKELLFRGLRWADLKRYNRDGANINLTRTVEGKIYNLPANDLRYAIAIPEDVIKLSGMQQNIR